MVKRRRVRCARGRNRAPKDIGDRCVGHRGDVLDKRMGRSRVISSRRKRKREELDQHILSHARTSPTETNSCSLKDVTSFSLFGHVVVGSPSQGLHRHTLRQFLPLSYSRKIHLCILQKNEGNFQLQRRSHVAIRVQNADKNAVGNDRSLNVTLRQRAQDELAPALQVHYSTLQICMTITEIVCRLRQVSSSGLVAMMSLIP